MTDYYEPTDVTLEERGTVTVEAPSVEAALEAVARQFGEGAQIVKAEKVTKGGIGGFFGKETYQITVARNPAPGGREVDDGGSSALTGEPESGGDDLSGQDSRSDTSTAAAVDLVLQRIEAGESDQSGSFGEALRAELRARSRADLPTSGTAVPETIDLRDGASTFDIPRAEPAGHMPWTRSVSRPSEGEAPPGGPTEAETRHSEHHVPRTEPVSGADPGPRAPAEEDSTNPAPFIPLGESVVESHGTAAPGVTYSPPGPAGPRKGTDRPLGWPSDGWEIGTGPVDWSLDRLARLGLPYSWLNRIDDLDPLDDMAWVHRLARIATEVCGPLPAGDQLIVGMDTRGVAGVFGLPSAVFPGVPNFEGDLAVSLLSPSGPALQWLDRIRAKRSLHLVVDSALPTPIATGLMPEVVSWVDGALTEALELVTEADVVLGYRFRSDGHAIRVSPFELALSIRELLPRR